MSDVVIAPIPALIEAYYGELRSYASRKLRNPVVAEDVVQEAWLRFASLGDDRIGNPRAYLYRLVRNLVIDQQRCERTRLGASAQPSDHIDVVDETADTERQLMARQRLALLTKAVSELPPRCRDCFVLRRFDDLDPDEIAKRMNISRNMVEKHLRQALVHCAKRLRESECFFLAVDLLLVSSSRTMRCGAASGSSRMRTVTASPIPTRQDARSVWDNTIDLNPASAVSTAGPWEPGGRRLRRHLPLRRRQSCTGRRRQRRPPLQRRDDRPARPEGGTGASQRLSRMVRRIEAGSI